LDFEIRYQKSEVRNQPNTQHSTPNTLRQIDIRKYKRITKPIPKLFGKKRDMKIFKQHLSANLA
jgi:hypothetical protein